ncbi:hypothetical protein H6G96_02895 [Nostoc sp. FACHB-892]|uniref:hypothetical protein n=1 Tax=Nostoc sp. FACHB-892 TaxID=2692843 RepID=UPI0016863571|nr:hypothetical protein [Nostoc sp. FACHB-892]MBD2725292.1 hypothetical protein [Nostoc sp. FACHB-892]
MPQILLYLYNGSLYGNGKIVGIEPRYVSWLNLAIAYCDFVSKAAQQYLILLAL